MPFPLIAMEGKITARRLVEMAVTMEESVAEFYGRAAEMGSETRSLFEDLARAEVKHAQIYKSLDPGGIFIGDVSEQGYLSDLLDTGILRDLSESGKLGKSPLNVDEAFPAAVQLEKETILFYTGLEPLLESSAKSTVQEIIAQEKEHLRRVVSARRKIKTVR